MVSLADFLGALVDDGNNDNDGNNGVRIFDDPDVLKEVGKSYLEKHEFTLGQLVQRKKGLKETKCPAEGRPAVVIEIMEGNRSTSKETGSPYYFEPNNIRVGVFLDGRFSAFWMDANRFEPYAEA